MKDNEIRDLETTDISHQEKSEPQKESFNWAAMFLLIAIIGGMGLVFVYMNTPTSSDIKTITVIEKYPYQYRGPAESIIDDNGIRYVFTKSQLWAKMKLNQTYEVRASKSPAYHDPLIDAIRINGVWYY